MGESNISAADARRWFWGLFAAAVALRVTAFNSFSAHHPDELFQYLEQTHRLVFGYGLIPWEYKEFIRSWLIPLMLVPPMQLGEWLDPGGSLYLVLPRAMIAALNFVPVIAAWFIGRRFSLQHAIVGMAVVGLWVESVHFSVQTLSESLAVAAFFAAAALLHDGARTRSIVAAGALLALGGLFRFQYGPAFAVFGAMMAGRDWRIWKALIIGGLPVVIAGGLVDVAMGLVPYEWIYNNYRTNIAEGKMQFIAGEGNPLTYFAELLLFWQFAILPILLLALAGWRKHRALAVAALVNLLLHQLIQHKEYRYIWLSIQIILLFAAWGSVELLQSGKLKRFVRNPGGNLATACVIGLWALASLLLSRTDIHRHDFRTDGDASRVATAALRNPRVCGLGVPRRPYWQFGYALLHEPKPVFAIGSEGLVTRNDPHLVESGFNALLVYEDERPPAPWRKTGCWGGPKERSCLYVRPGGCRIDSANQPMLIQEAMNAAGM